MLFVENLGFVEPTAARRISFDETLRFEALHRRVYEQSGYECVSIPAAPLTKRLALLKAAIE